MPLLRSRNWSGLFRRLGYDVSESIRIGYGDIWLRMSLSSSWNIASIDH